MPKLEFSIDLGADSKKIMEIMTDYERYPRFLGNHIKDVKIQEKKDNEIITEEIMSFSSYLRHEITQKAIHKKINSEELYTEIISGPFKGTSISVISKKTDTGTRVNVKADLKLGLKYKIFGSIIKKLYKIILTNFLIKIEGLAILTEGKTWNESLEGDCLTISKKGLPPLSFYDWYRGDLKGSFIDEEYSSLPIDNRVVIDIGSNICDSGIYFAIKGAQKVITIEPLPKNYESAKKNIEINNLSNKIIALLAGCSDKVGEIQINPSDEGTSYRLKQYDEGVKIPTITLEHLLETYHIDSAVLKLDCEGCEYDVILSSSKDVLRKFTDMLIEYHNGFSTLKEKLEKSGFNVTIIEIDTGNYREKKGYINATRVG